MTTNRPISSMVCRFICPMCLCDCAMYDSICARHIYILLLSYLCLYSMSVRVLPHSRSRCMICVYDGMYVCVSEWASVPLCMHSIFASADIGSHSSIHTIETNSSDAFLFSDAFFGICNFGHLNAIQMCAKLTVHFFSDCSATTNREKKKCVISLFCSAKRILFLNSVLSEPFKIWIRIST